MDSSSKRRRRNEECERCSCHSAKKKKHLYLVVDDWKGGYSIHKLDADNTEDHLPEHGALRLVSSERGGPMAFSALGTKIFIATNPHCSRNPAPQLLVYDTEAAAITVGPPPPDGNLRELGNAVAVGGKLYALTFFCDDEAHQSSSLQVLSWEPTTHQRKGPWDASMAWSWDTLSAPPPTFMAYETITSYAVHPDGRTIFMSTGWHTHSVDTSNGVWRDLGEWMLPFRGQAYFDGELDAWVGLHYKEEGYICCCPVASRSAKWTTRQPECKILMEKLFRRSGEDKHPYGRYLSATLTYMGDSKFCLIESVLRSKMTLEAAVLHVTMFGLKYNHKRELKTKSHRTTRFYGLSKNTILFSHAAFWM